MTVVLQVRCGSFVESGRCPGRVIATDEVGDLLHGECDRCGSAFAVPKLRVDQTLRRQRRLEAAGLPGRYVGQRFDETPENRDALAAVRQWVSGVTKGSDGEMVGAIPGPAFWGLAGRGKALDIDTAIPTPDGWKTMGDLVAGDVVFGSDGSPTKVLAAHPVLLGRECFEVRFSDGARIVADADHLWRITDKAARQSIRTRNARAGRQLGLLDDRGTRVDQSYLWRGPRVLTTLELAEVVAKSARKPSIACCQPVQFPEADLPIDPYVLGVWLGDGHSNTALITANVDDAGFYASQFAAIGERISDFDADRRNPSVVRFRFGHARGQRGPRRDGGHSRLRALGLLHNKHIPEVYLRASVTQRLGLLQGLVDADGSVTSHGGVELTLTCERLATDAVALALSLGLRATISESAAMLDGREVSRRWRIKWTSPLPTARLSRKAEKLRRDSTSRATHRYIVAVERVPSRPVRCITVGAADSLYLAGREYIATHNTHLLVATCWKLVCERNLSVAFWTMRGLLRELQQFESPGARRVWERASTVDVLALDDVGAMQQTEWRTDQLADLVNVRWESRLPVMVATNYAPSTWLDVLDERTASRLRGLCFPVELRGADRRVTA